MFTHYLKNIGLVSLFISTQVFAQHNPEGKHKGWPENSLLVLEGQDAISKRDCFLFVTEVGFTGSEQTAEQFFAVIETNYVHGGDKPAPFTIKLLKDKPGVLSGVSNNGKDQIAIFLNPNDLDLRNIKSFNLRWLHGNHYHSNRCVNMNIHQH